MRGKANHAQHVSIFPFSISLMASSNATSLANSMFETSGGVSREKGVQFLGGLASLLNATSLRPSNSRRLAISFRRGFAMSTISQSQSVEKPCGSPSRRETSSASASTNDSIRPDSNRTSRSGLRRLAFRYTSRITDTGIIISYFRYLPMMNYRGRGFVSALRSRYFCLATGIRIQVTA